MPRVIHFKNVFRLIKHTGRLLEEKQEKLCIKVLQTLKDMMSVEMELGLKVFPQSTHEHMLQKCLLSWDVFSIALVLCMKSDYDTVRICNKIFAELLHCNKYSR